MFSILFLIDKRQEFSILKRTLYADIAENFKISKISQNTDSLKMQDKNGIKYLLPSVKCQSSTERCPCYICKESKENGYCPLLQIIPEKIFKACNTQCFRHTLGLKVLFGHEQTPYFVIVSSNVDGPQKY